MRVWIGAAALALAACASGGNPDPIYPQLDLYGPDLPCAPDGGGGSGDLAAPCSKCSTGNPCTQGLCVPLGCKTINTVKGTKCDDGNACTTNDQCDGFGACKGVDENDVVYRFRHWGKDVYFYSRTTSGVPTGFGLDKKLCKVPRTASSLTAPLNRLSGNTEYILSRTTTQTNYAFSGSIGHVFLGQQSGTVALYRAKKPASGTTPARHISSLDKLERSADGFVWEVDLGYVCPP